MTFRGRLSALAAVAVAIAVAAASIVTYVIVGHQLRSQVDASLRTLAGGTTLSAHAGARGRAEVIPASGVGTLRAPPSLGQVASGSRRNQARPATLEVPELSPGSSPGFAQAVKPDGRVIGLSSESAEIPVGSSATQVASGKRGAFFSDVDVGGTRLRVLTTQLRPGEAVQVARPVNEVDATMRRLAGILGLITLGGIGLAAFLGRGVARSAAAPVSQLSDAAEHVARTRDLSARIDAGGHGDELDRLAKSFNGMLGALEEAEDAQRQLVADASHELRTPLTSIRTNIEVLSKPEQVAGPDRERLLSDLNSQLDELSNLVVGLVDLARDEEGDQLREDLRFDELVTGLVRRAERRGARFEVKARPCAVYGSPERLGRAVSNLLDNAAKWNGDCVPIEVTVEDGVLTVRDHGPGLAPDDIPRLFDRFYRSPSARAKPGSGLGLAIARQVAEAHGGSVAASNAPEGGATLRLVLPTISQEISA